MTSLADQFLDDLASSSEDHDESVSEQPADSNENRAPSPSLQQNRGSSEYDELVHRVQGLRGLEPTDDLMQECVTAIANTRHEASDAHVRLRECYSPRFPELSTLLPSPKEYMRAVHVLGNNIGDSKHLKQFLSAGTVITIEVAASASTGRLLQKDEMTRVQALYQKLAHLENVENVLLQFLENQMGTMAPNLTAIVGGAVAAQLISETGSLEAFARIPGCNVKVLGKVHKAFQGGNVAFAARHEGYVYTCPLVLSLPPALRKKGGDMVANKASLAGRVDCARESRDGQVGRRFREYIESSFERWQEPAPARTAKPLPVPDEIRKKHRAGKRARKNKELCGMSEMRKQANRVKFGQAEENYGNDVESGGLGLLAAENSGRMRIAPKRTNSVELAANRRLARDARKRTGPSVAIASGLTTTVEGLELGTKTPAPGGVGLGSIDARDGTRSVYFSSNTGFFGATKDKAR